MREEEIEISAVVTARVRVSSREDLQGAEQRLGILLFNALQPLEDASVKGRLVANSYEYVGAPSAPYLEDAATAVDCTVSIGEGVVWVDAAPVGRVSELS